MYTDQALKALEETLRQGVLTPANKVDADSLLCLVETTPMGKLYHQLHISQLPKPFQELLLDKPKGFEHGALKVVAIFDVWDSVAA